MHRPPVGTGAHRPREGVSVVTEAADAVDESVVGLVGKIGDQVEMATATRFAGSGDMTPRVHS